jgi:2-polyprenyl-3-methyl-5-hydroxy-6-metoxy-1,4-benzoquinol methylase
MRKDAIPLEEKRLEGVNEIEDYPSFHERHRIFPEVFESREIKKVLDIASGVGCAAKRIQDNTSVEVTCNDITPACLEILEKQSLKTVSFDIDSSNNIYPFNNGEFDAVISLATIEHVIHLDHHMEEVNRIIRDDGYLFISSPNYAGLVHLPRYLLTGRSFHNPLNESDRYEFYAHVRYFTYRTLLEFVSSFDFVLDSVYLPLPSGSTFYQALYSRSRPRALLFRYAMWAMYTFLSPRWATEPVMCFEKTKRRLDRKPKKVVL